MNRVLALLLAWLVPAWLLPAFAAELPPLQGRWDVVYRDAHLGVVSGTAHVSDDERSVEIAYRHPEDGRTLLAAGTVERGPDDVRIRLAGAMVSADRSLPALDTDVVVAGDGPLTARSADAEATVAVAAEPPAGDLELLLRPTATEGTLSGTWTAPVSATTGLPPGGGRAGTFRLLYDGAGGAVMEGFETWQRPVARLVTALPLADQLLMSLGDPDFPEPFDAAGRQTKPIADRRLIAVLGKGLPLRYGDPAVLASRDPGVEYSVYQLQWDFDRPDTQAWPRERAWQMLAREFGEARLRELRGLDLVILEARLKPGVLPGPKTFTLNGAEAAWLLQYGDWKGELAIARDIGFDQSEPADYLVPGETIRLQVRLDRAVALTEIPVLLAVADADGKTLRYALLGGRRAIPLQRDPDDPKLYRSEPIRLAEPEYLDGFAEGSRVVAVTRGESLIASLTGDPVFELRPRLAIAAVLQSPRHLKAHLTGERKGRSRTWDEAVGAAAACVGAEAPGAVALSEEESETFESTILTSASTGLFGDKPGWWLTLATKVKIGEHAAAILLRDVFLDLMTQKIQQLSQSLDDEGLMGFRQLVGSDLYGAFAALADVEVRGPNGGTVSFAVSFSDNLMRDTYGLSGEALERYQLIATIDARVNYLVAAREARQTAAEIEDCDLDELLKLTGFDFAPVRRVAKQLAIALSPEEIGGEGPRWVADRRARAWMDRVELVAQSLAEQRALARMDNAILLTAFFIATLPVALVEAPAALIALMILDGADLLYSSYELVSTVREVSAETEFALGASVLLGNRRFRAAEARRYDWVPYFFGAVASGAGAAFSAIDVYEGLATQTHRAARLDGNEAIARITGGRADPGDVPQLASLSPEEGAAMLEAIFEARRIEARLGTAALEAEEHLALALSDTLAEAAAAIPARPVWAEHLSDELFQRLGFRADAGHVIALFGRDPQRMAELVAVPGALDLLSLPWRSVEAFAAAVTAHARRSPPQGADFMYQMHAPHPEGVSIAGGFEPVAPGSIHGAATYMIYPEAMGSKSLGRFERSLSDDDFLNTGGSMLTLEVARIDTPMWLPGFPFPLVEGRGVPLGMYMNLRSMLDLGLGFADRGLTVVKYSNIINLNTCAQMRWLRRTYPKAPLGDLFRATHSFDYARNFLEQAGLRIDDVVVRGDAILIGTTPRDLDAGGWYAAAEPLDDFLRRYEVGADEVIDTGYDVYLRVSPLQ